MRRTLLVLAVAAVVTTIIAANASQAFGAPESCLAIANFTAEPGQVGSAVRPLGVEFGNLFGQSNVESAQLKTPCSLASEGGPPRAFDPKPPPPPPDPCLENPSLSECQQK